jgi:hypothetical protein
MRYEWIIYRIETMLKRKDNGCGYSTIIIIIIVIRLKCLLLFMHKAINLSLLSNKQLSPTCTDRLIEYMTFIILEKRCSTRSYFDIEMHEWNYRFLSWLSSLRKWTLLDLSQSMCLNLYLIYPLKISRMYVVY